MSGTPIEILAERLQNLDAKITQFRQGVKGLFTQKREAMEALQQALAEKRLQVAERQRCDTLVERLRPALETGGSYDPDVIRADLFNTTQEYTSYIDRLFEADAPEEKDKIHDWSPTKHESKAWSSGKRRKQNARNISEKLIARRDALPADDVPAQMEGQLVALQSDLKKLKTVYQLVDTHADHQALAAQRDPLRTAYDEMASFEWYNASDSMLIARGLVEYTQLRQIQAAFQEWVSYVDSLAGVVPERSELEIHYQKFVATMTDELLAQTSVKNTVDEQYQSLRQLSLTPSVHESDGHDASPHEEGGSDGDVASLLDNGASLHEGEGSDGDVASLLDNEASPHEEGDSDGDVDLEALRVRLQALQGVVEGKLLSDVSYDEEMKIIAEIMETLRSYSTPTALTSVDDISPGYTAWSQRIMDIQLKIKVYSLLQPASLPNVTREWVQEQTLLNLLQFVNQHLGQEVTAPQKIALNQAKALLLELPWCNQLPPKPSDVEVLLQGIEKPEVKSYFNKMLMFSSKTNSSCLTPEQKQRMCAVYLDVIHFLAQQHTLATFTQHKELIAAQLDAVSDAVLPSPFLYRLLNFFANLVIGLLTVGIVHRQHYRKETRGTTLERLTLFREQNYRDYCAEIREQLNEGTHIFSDEVVEAEPANFAMAPM